MNLPTENNAAFKDMVKLALFFNFVMFFVEFFAGFFANSLSLITDSFDFLGDSLNYLVAIYVLKKSQKIQSYSALIKGLFMLTFAVFITFNAFQRFSSPAPQIPNSLLMISISFLALMVNLLVSVLLFKFRHGSSNQKSVWLCSRNDTINNILVIAAGFAVFYFQNSIPDLIAAAIMAILAASSSIVIFKSVYRELKG